MTLHLVRTSAAAVLVTLVSAVTAQAQGNFRGRVTDEWDNPLPGAQVVMQPQNVAAGPAETSTEEDGSFQFLNLASGDWILEATADGYYPVRLAVPIRRATTNRPVMVELEAMPPGGWFTDDVEFEAEGGTPTLSFDAEGRFAFNDADGEGEGTYGIVERSAVMIVREYDGPEEKYSITEPVIVRFSSGEFASVAWGEDELARK